MRVNINYERGDLTFAQKSHPSPDDFGETFAFNLIKKCNTIFFHPFKAKVFVVPLHAAVLILDDPHRLTSCVRI